MTVEDPQQDAELLTLHQARKSVSPSSLSNSNIGSTYARSKRKNVPRKLRRIDLHDTEEDVLMGCALGTDMGGNSEEYMEEDIKLLDNDYQGDAYGGVKDEFLRQEMNNQDLLENTVSNKLLRYTTNRHRKLLTYPTITSMADKGYPQDHLMSRNAKYDQSNMELSTDSNYPPTRFRSTINNGSKTLDELLNGTVNTIYPPTAYSLNVADDAENRNLLNVLKTDPNRSSIDDISEGREHGIPIDEFNSYSYKINNNEKGNYPVEDSFEAATKTLLLQHQSKLLLTELFNNYSSFYEKLQKHMQQGRDQQDDDSKPVSNLANSANRRGRGKLDPYDVNPGDTPNSTTMRPSDLEEIQSKTTTLFSNGTGNLDFSSFLPFLAAASNTSSGGSNGNSGLPAVLEEYYKLTTGDRSERVNENNGYLPIANKDNKKSSGGTSSNLFASLLANLTGASGDHQIHYSSSLDNTVTHDAPKHTGSSIYNATPSSPSKRSYTSSSTYRSNNSPATSNKANATSTNPPTGSTTATPPSTGRICDVCGKIYASSSTLSRHKRIHRSPVHQSTRGGARSTAAANKHNSNTLIHNNLNTSVPPASTHNLSSKFAPSNNKNTYNNSTYNNMSSTNQHQFSPFHLASFMLGSSLMQHQQTPSSLSISDILANSIIGKNIDSSNNNNNLSNSKTHHPKKSTVSCHGITPAVTLSSYHSDNLRHLLTSSNLSTTPFSYNDNNNNNSILTDRHRTATHHALPTSSAKKASSKSTAAKLFQQQPEDEKIPSSSSFSRLKSSPVHENRNDSIAAGSTVEESEGTGSGGSAKKHICVLCGKIFSRLWLLKGHIEVSHQDDDEIFNHSAMQGIEE